MMAIITPPSVHDAKETVELIENAHPANHYILGAEDYLGKDLTFISSYSKCVTYSEHLIVRT